MYKLSERAKLRLLCLLLLLMLVVLAFTAVNTIHAVQSFQQQNNAVEAGDVRTIHPWMTIHVVSHIYHVPEDYLYSSLGISSTNLLRHATLYEIASRKRQTVDQVIRTVQHAILAYRKNHPPALTPTPSPSTTRKTDTKPPSSRPGRK